MPQNMAAQFPIRGWGPVSLQPYPVENPLARTLTEILLTHHKDRVFLVNHKDWSSLSDKFRKGKDKSDYTLTKEEKKEIEAEPEPNPPVSEQSQEENVEPPPAVKPKKKDGDK